MDTVKRLWPQLRPSPAAPLTESNLPPQTGKVIIVTGSTAGIGYELTRILYGAGATVYMAARSPAKANKAIETIKNAEYPSKVPGGQIKFLQVDFSDLRTVKPSVSKFLEQETRLDVLINNAGTANVPATERTTQGLEVHMGVNCVGAFLMTKLLSPILISTAADPSTPRDTVRVVFSSSMLVDAIAPPEGVPPKELQEPSMNQDRNYAVSKVGTWFLAERFSRELKPRGVISVTQNPGNLLTAIYDNTPRVIVWASLPVLFRAVDGANTVL